MKVTGSQIARTVQLARVAPQSEHVQAKLQLYQRPSRMMCVECLGRSAEAFSTLLDDSHCGWWVAHVMMSATARRGLLMGVVNRRSGVRRPNFVRGYVAVLVALVV